MAIVTLKGNPFRTNGELPPVGSQAPDFRLVNGDLQDVTLADFRGKKKILNIVPCLETSVCATSARKFNEKVSEMSGVALMVISSDMPLAQKRVCSVEGLDKVVTLSLMRSRNFAKDYGVLFVDGPLEGTTARAVVVLDESDKVIHSQLVPEIGQEPDYEAALAALK